MKAKHIGLMGMLLAAMTVSAQTSKPGKTAYEDDRYNSYDRIHSVNGKLVEELQMNHNGKVYKADFVNNKMTALFVDGENISESEWAAHSNAITAIRTQLELNKEQAKANAKQAAKNAEQDARNADQAKRNAEQASVNEVQEKHNQEQAQLNEVQAKKNAEQDARNDVQAKHNNEQAQVNEVQAKKNAEQARANEEQAKRNAEQAAENERFIKQLTEDLVTDKIIPDMNSLREFNLSKSEMTVNGVKQTDAVFKKYQEKYSKQSSGGFNYSRDGILINN